MPALQAARTAAPPLLWDAVATPQKAAACEACGAIDTSKPACLGAAGRTAGAAGSTADAAGMTAGAAGIAAGAAGMTAGAVGHSRHLSCPPTPLLNPLLHQGTVTPLAPAPVRARGRAPVKRPSFIMQVGQRQRMRAASVCTHVCVCVCERVHAYMGVCLRVHASECTCACREVKRTADEVRVSLQVRAAMEVCGGAWDACQGLGGTTQTCVGLTLASGRRKELSGAQMAWMLGVFG